MQVSDWLSDWHIHTCTHTQLTLAGLLFYFHLNKPMCITITQQQWKQWEDNTQLYGFSVIDKQITRKGGKDGTHSLSVLRGILLGIVLRPSPWQSTVVPLQVQSVGQPLASPNIRAKSISSHIHCLAILPMIDSEPLPSKGMFKASFFLFSFLIVSFLWLPQVLPHLTSLLK